MAQSHPALISVTMSKRESFAVVLVTAPDLKTARRLARAALKARIVACANLIRGVESHYWWNAKLQTGSEVLLLCKTAQANLPTLEKLVLAGHPYETPEFLVLRIERGNPRYLRWLSDSCSGCD